MTAPKPDLTLPIDVRGDVQLDGPSGRQLMLRASGSRLRLSAPGSDAFQQLGPRSLLSQRRALAAAGSALQKLNLTLDVDVNGRRAFGLGSGIKTSTLARLAGLPSADIRLSTVVTALRSRARAPR